MNKEILLSKIERINIWKLDGKRAPNKPLLLLYALSEYLNYDKVMLPYDQVHNDLSLLLKEFGPQRKVYHPEYPFVRLRNDGLWDLNFKKDNGDKSPKWLIKENIVGGFTEEVIRLLRSDPTIIDEIIENILENHFPPTIHDEILNSLNLEHGKFSSRKEYYLSKVKSRDPSFRQKVLNAYNNSCAICGYKIQIDKQYVGLEAAHIKWHQAKGPDIEANGLALCSIHHKLFDLGAFTLNANHKIIVSNLVENSKSKEEWLLKYQSKQITEPINSHHYAADEYLIWHNKEVYKSELVNK